MRENILLGQPDDDQLVTAIRAAVLEEDLAKFDKQFDTAIGPKGVKLSGGQQQRLAMARMMVRNPELLVIDDISSTVDVETERLPWERMATQIPKVTCLAVSNRREALRRADLVLVLHNGQLIARGTADQLRDEYAEFRGIWGETG